MIIDCKECGFTHVELEMGSIYKINAKDCCLVVNDLIGTYRGWVPSEDGSVDHDLLQFDNFRLGYGYMTDGFIFEKVGEEI